ncbi:MAG: Hsp20/alpha crystallin family protein [Gammaproteobacteria bacterium]|nr:Hsp20/alpha crystallin family protein [Gammaproteobacteria bacterium]
MRTALTHYRPWSLLGEFNRELEERLNPAYGANDPGSDWTPAVDVREENDRYLIRADLPGVKPEDIDITLEGDYLTLRGRRDYETEAKDNGWRHRERLHGSFYRRFSLPDSADPEQVSARSNHGVLEVTIPKAARIKPRKISVAAA